MIARWKDNLRLQTQPSPTTADNPAPMDRAPAQTLPPVRQPSTAGNILANWVWYFFVLVSGFITPRLLNQHIGKEMLGVWDLGWAFVLYVSWLNLGVNASVVRYVARYRALEEWDELNATINSSLALLLIGCVVGIILSATFTHFISFMLPDAHPTAIRAGRYVVFFLCASASFQLPGSVFNAVITGCERFDILNIIRVARDAAILCIMIGLLLAGRGVVACAFTVFACEFTGEIAKIFVARRLCPQLRINPSHCKKAAINSMIVYGGKTVAQGLASGSVYQLNSMLVSSMLGAPTLAVYSRQRALVLHALRFMKQYAQVFIPKSSALDADGDHAALRRLQLNSSRFGLYITLPLMLVLVIMGGPLLRFWMGPTFEAPLVLTILTIGHLLMVPQQGIYSILMGMNRHGRIAIYDVISLVISVCLGYFLMGPGQMGMVGAAIAVSAPIAVFSGIIMPIYACRLLKMNVIEYFRETASGPLLASLPLLGILLASRALVGEYPQRSLCVGLVIGGLVTAIIYWRWVIPDYLKTAFLNRLRGARVMMPRPAPLAPVIDEVRAD